MRAIRVETSSATILLTEAPEPKVKDRQTGEIAKDAVKGKAGQPEKAWLLFVGTQDAEDATLFTVNRYPFICCRVGGMIWPRR